MLIELKLYQIGKSSKVVKNVSLITLIIINVTKLHL